MRTRALLLLAVVGLVLVWPVGAATGGTTVASATSTASGSTAPGGTAGISDAASSADPAVNITIDSTRMGEGEVFKTGHDDGITIDAAVGNGTVSGSALSEIVVRIDGEHYRSIPTNGTNVTETVYPDFRTGENEVRVIVTDDADNVNATQFTVAKDTDPPVVFLTEPYESTPWKEIHNGTVESRNVTLAGKIIEDFSVEQIYVTHDYGGERDTVQLRDAQQNFSVPLSLGYTGADDRTNEIRILATDEFGNDGIYEFSINATDRTDPTISFDPHPEKTTQNRVEIAGTVEDDVWIQRANLTLRWPNGNRSHFETIRQPARYERNGDGRVASFSTSLYMVRQGVFDATVNVTDIAGHTTTKTVTIERLEADGSVAPDIAMDEDRTVVLDEETLFLSGDVFDGLTRRVVIDTRDADTGETYDYRVVHSDEKTEQVSFDTEVEIDGRTKVTVRAIDATDEEHSKHFFVNGQTKETFVGDTNDSDTDDSDTDDSDTDDSDTDDSDTDDSDTDDSNGDSSGPTVSVEPRVDGRPGTASAAVTIQGATAGSMVTVPPENGSANVTTTANFTLDRMVVNFSGTGGLDAGVATREAGHGPLAAPDRSTSVGTVTLQHSLSAENVSAVTLDLRVRRAFLDAFGFKPEELTVYRLSDGGWSNVTSRIVESTDRHVRYEIDSPGLSVFALATEPSDADPSNETETGNRTAEDDWSFANQTAWPPGNETGWDVELDGAGNETGGNESVVGGNESAVDGNESSGDPKGNETAGNETAGNETASDGSDEQTSTGGEAVIFVTNVTVNRTEAGINESVLVNATVSNSGNATGTYVVGLQAIQQLNRTFVEKQSVEVPAGERREVQFVTRFAEPGNHTVSVNGTQAGPVTVEEGGGGLLSVFSFIPVELIGMGLGGLLGLGLVLVLVRFVLRRVGNSGEGASG